MPLIVTGMHRSGTSLAASFIQSLGVNVGNNLFRADDHNKKGYFEDVDFLEFQRTLLQDCCRDGDPGFPDWGWTESEYLNRRKFDNYIEKAKKIIDVRYQKLDIWGWKDPRTSLMLDFWDRLLPDAKYILVYRLPWEVANSIQRVNSTVFAERPDYAYRIWSYYNRHLLKFYQQHSERCILFNVNSWIKKPGKLVELLHNKLELEFADGWDEDQFKKMYDQKIFKTVDWHNHAVKFLSYSNPEYFSLLEELDQVADIPSEFSLEKVDWKIDALKKDNWESQSTSDIEVETAVFEDNSPKEAEKIEAMEPENLVELENPMANEGKKEITISVVIPCYNQGEYILEAISSVESCQEDIYEIVIVNDASTENLTKKVLNYLKESGYWVIDHQRNQGVAVARNTGIKKARGRYILPLDADNKIRPEYMTKAIKILDEQPEVGVVYADAQLFGHKTGIYEVPEFDINKIASGNYIDACAVFRKEVWLDCGGYDDKIPDKLGYEDWEFWLSAASKGWKFAHIPQVLFDYRVRPDSMVNACRIPENHEKLVRYISTKHLDIYKTNFANILAEKDAALLKEKLRCEDMENELQKIQLAWEESKQEVQQIHYSWEESQAEVERIQLAWAQSQGEIKQLQSAWEQAQSEVHRIQSAWEQSQEELRLTYAQWLRSQSEVKQIQTAWEQAQQEFQLTHRAWEQSQLELQRIQINWEQAQQQSQTQVQQMQVNWQQAELELKQIQSGWEKAQDQVHLTHNEWERAQQQFQIIHREWERSQSQMQLVQTGWEEAQQQAQRIQTAWDQAQQEKQQSQSELSQIKTDWVRSQSELQQIKTDWVRSQQQFQIIQAELAQSRATIDGIQSSKFWKLRNIWFRFKQAIGLSNNSTNK